MKLRDVVILGGGPAGCATALSLRAHAPALSVSLVEASSYEGKRIGEVLPSVSRAFFHQLGILSAFEKEGFQPAPSASSVWGEAACRENHFIYSVYGAGWHLDRARFDKFLSREAAARRVEVLPNTRPLHVERAGDRWHLQLTDGHEIFARFVVDATGRRAAFARSLGARQISFDRLTGFARFFTLDKDAAPGTLVEAFPDGWWYTALAGHLRVVVCLTDTDVARKLALRDEEKWTALLSSTRWISRSVGGGALEEGPIICSANSVRLDRVCSTDWIAVGDAASAFDPLSSQGIVKSLRAGIFASYAIADLLEKADARGLARYEKFIQSEFTRYREKHFEYCNQERRWPESIFWRRRHQS